MLKIEIDDSAFKKELGKLQEAAQELSQKTEISLGELFPDKFMKVFTDYASIDEFMEAAGIRSPQDFEAIDEIDFDAFVVVNTSFKSWEDMLNSAYEVYVSKTLGIQ